MIKAVKLPLDSIIRLQKDEAVETEAGTTIVIGPLMAFAAISALSLPGDHKYDLSGLHNGLYAHR